MFENHANEKMLDMFIFETTQLIEQLEQSILAGEQSSCLTQSVVNEVFRNMHTIKGSAAMMSYVHISKLAHSMEDLFYFIRETRPPHIDYTDLTDIVLDCLDFIKLEMQKLKNGDIPDGEASDQIRRIEHFLFAIRQGMNLGNSPEMKQSILIKQHGETDTDKLLKTVSLNTYRAIIYFDEGCEMENIRAFSIIHRLEALSNEISYAPEDIVENDESTAIIRREGFKIVFKTDCRYEQIYDFFMQTVFLKDLELIQIDNDVELMQLSDSNRPSHAYQQSAAGSAMDIPNKAKNEHGLKDGQSASSQQSIISVSVAKLDKLLDLVGEIVIAEDMVTQNPELNGLLLNDFHHASRHLQKITNELQDLVMSIRMVPLAVTFQKMKRIVRDMCRQLGKEARLELLGENTEVDKNIIEHVSDPLMHLIRNSLDHGIEAPEVRQAKGKPQIGTITLEARSVGSDVLIIVQDDGCGLDREKILHKAKANNLLGKSEDEMSDNEVYNLIFLPGFSTKDSITEFSGRGVGMDVVVKNIETVSGTVSVNSIKGAGTTIIMKIPLTLAIIDGMNVRVGNSCYTIPIISVKESFRPKPGDIIKDPDGNEMIMVRGICYRVIRLHEHFDVRPKFTELADGILLMVESKGQTICIFVDELSGKQQVVVKALPEYIRRIRKIKGLAGCTLLGDGSISLILDIAGLLA